MESNLLEISSVVQVESFIMVTYVKVHQSILSVGKIEPTIVDLCGMDITVRCGVVHGGVFRRVSKCRKELDSLALIEIIVCNRIVN